METRTIKGKVEAKPTAEEELIVVTPKEIQDHLKWGQALFEKGHYEEALAEFEAVLRTAPGSIEARVWIRKTKEAIAQPAVEPTVEEKTTAEAVKPKEFDSKKLAWMKYKLYPWQRLGFDRAEYTDRAHELHELAAQHMIGQRFAHAYGAPIEGEKFGKGGVLTRLEITSERKKGGLIEHRPHLGRIELAQR